jgi:hypothetical protein
VMWKYVGHNLSRGLWKQVTGRGGDECCRRSLEYSNFSRKEHVLWEYCHVY